MSELDLTPNFTVEDIHKIREYNDKKYSNLPLETRYKDYRKIADELQRKINELKIIKKKTKNSIVVVRK